VSSPFLHPEQAKPQGTEWAARLIPGAASVSGRKKPQRETTGYAARLPSDAVVPFSDAGPKSDAKSVPPGELGRPRGRADESWVQSGLARIAGILHSGALLASRWAEREGKQSDPRVLGGVRNVLIVGAGGLGRRLASNFEKHPELGRSVCGFVDDWKPLGNGVIGRISELAELARTGFVDEVILAGPHDREKTLRVLRKAQQLRLDVKIAPDLFGCEPTRETERIGGIPLICLHAERLPVTALFLKRALDLVGAGVLLILMAPTLALLALLVKLDSPGPALYGAPRAGRKGRPFLCYKFRTMVRSADALKEGLRGRNQRQGPFFKISDDPRITRVGRLLRRYSLDELPQLWNVLKGEMSLVGPRPHPLDDFAAYSIEHLPRLDVIPGITGLWQITARRDPSFQAGMNLDLEYIHRWSLGMDLRILLKTALVVLRGGGE
jgi:exopolysaccharide biosynthesis polyprenyl glycosylphosphotransferase